MLEIILKIPALGWLGISAFFLALGDFASKYWANSPTLSLAVLTIILYCGSSLSWLPALYQRNQLALMGAAWSVITAMLTVLIGAIWFKEILLMQHWIGLGFAFIALFLLSY